MAKCAVQPPCSDRITWRMQDGTHDHKVAVPVAQQLWQFAIGRQPSSQLRPGCAPRSAATHGSHMGLAPPHWPGLRADAPRAPPPTARPSGSPAAPRSWHDGVCELQPPLPLTCLGAYYLAVLGCYVTYSWGFR